MALAYAAAAPPPPRPLKCTSVRRRVSRAQPLWTKTPELHASICPAMNASVSVEACFQEARFSGTCQCSECSMILKPHAFHEGGRDCEGLGGWVGGLVGFFMTGKADLKRSSPVTAFVSPL